MAQVKSIRKPSGKKEGQRTHPNNEAKLQAEKQKQLLLIKRKQEKLAAKRQKERERIEREKIRGKVLPTRVIDESNLIPLRIDSKTVIYVKPGVDQEKIKQKFQQRNSNRNE